MQGADADPDAEPVPECFEREVGLLGDRPAQGGLMTDMERLGFLERRPGRDFAGGLMAADELTDPFGAGGVLAGQAGEVHAGKKVGENPLAQIDGKRTHTKTPEDRKFSMRTRFR